jgi:hypothetical protein
MTVLNTFIKHPVTQTMMSQALALGFHPVSDAPADMYYASIDICKRDPNKGTATLEIAFEIPDDAPKSVRAWPVLDVYEAGIELYKGSAQDSEWFTVPEGPKAKERLVNEILSTLHKSTGKNVNNERIKLSVIDSFADIAIAFAAWANDFNLSQQKAG